MDSGPEGREFEALSCQVYFFSTFLYFLVRFEGSGVRTMAKNGIYTAAHGSHETSLFRSSILSYLCSIKEHWRKLAQMGQSFSFLHFYLVEKRKKLIFFKFPRANSKI